MSPSDHDLLDDYARRGAQPAFAALVDRHLNLVYSAALRQVRSPQLAEEVAQSVFLDLARQAPTLPRTAPIVAWLHVVSRRTAIDVVRRESRRQVREQHAAREAATGGEPVASDMKTNPPVWAAVEPLLDEAVESLPETDRAAILLRYFENKTLREIGVAFGTSDDAAQKRVSRAVEQLRTFFLRRGVTVTAAGLATDLSAHALHVAPAALSTHIAAMATSTASHAVATLTMTTLQKCLLGSGLALALGGAALEANALRRERTELASAHQHTALLAGEMNAWLERVATLKRLRTQRTDLTVPELALFSDEDWLQSARDARLETEEQTRATFAHLRLAAENNFISKLQSALRLYTDAHGGALPADARDLASSFAPAVEPAILDRYKMMRQGRLADLPSRGDFVIEQDAPVDFERDTTWRIGLNGFTSEAALGRRTHEAVVKFNQAHDGAEPTTPEQLVPYLPHPVDPAKLRPFMPSAR